MKAGNARTARTLRLADHAVDVRPGIQVPDVGMYATLGRLTRPRLTDGLDEPWSVTPDGEGGFVAATEGRADENQRP